jgi:hypothetical protein
MKNKSEVTLVVQGTVVLLTFHQPGVGTTTIKLNAHNAEIFGKALIEHRQGERRWYIPKDATR